MRFLSYCPNCHRDTVTCRVKRNFIEKNVTSRGCHKYMCTECGTEYINDFSGDYYHDKPKSSSVDLEEN